MNRLLVLFAFLMTSTFVLNDALADEHGSKNMEKQQHKEMKKSANDNEKPHKYKKQSNDNQNDKKVNRKNADDDYDMNKDDNEKQGLKKQQEKKASQERKEEGKGSEQGQSSRKEHSKKWWKFWGE